MLRNRSSKTVLWRPSASAGLAPASPSLVTSPVTRPKYGLLACLARMCRHWTSGRPAEIMVANWRVKIARSLVLTDTPPILGSLNPPLGRSEVTRIFFLRSSSSASSCRPTSISPLWASPARVRPFQTNVAIASSLCRQLQDLLEHRLQLGPVRAALERIHRGERLVGDRLEQRLIHGLHAELLPRLHEAVDLVGLALADDRADRRGAHQHLRHHHPALAAAARDELLRHDALQGERKLGVDLLLLVGREHVHH